MSDEKQTDPIDQLGMIHEQTSSMLLMLMVYLDQLRDGGEELSINVLESYAGQMQANMELAEQATQEITDLINGKKE